MTARHFLSRLRRNCAGSVVVEFAIIAPALIVMLLGVFQVGIALQNYNALRAVSADVSRHMMIQYATGNKLSNTQLTAYATGVARGAPYLLNSSVNVSITDVATAQVTGAREKTLKIDYQVPSILDSMGLQGPRISFSRPVFVTR